MNVFQKLKDFIFDKFPCIIGGLIVVKKLVNCYTSLFCILNSKLI